MAFPSLAWHNAAAPRSAHWILNDRTTLVEPRWSKLE